MTLMTRRPIAISGTQPDGFEALLDLADGLNVPDGHKAEIVNGNVVVSPWPKGYCHRVMRLVCRQLEPYLPEGHVIDRSPTLYVFPGSGCAYGPDIHAAHERAFDTEGNRLDGEALSFVAELTSPSTRLDDLTDKVETYGQAGVPVYLILDMQEEQAIVYGSPSVKGYEIRFSKPFGEKIDIPLPFGCTLDTAGFQAPASPEK
ncbi:Endonuclease, Uma2 family (restriction endonuclease fold) [Streptomyces sp. yr375]|uniref:Uma2 family endonuclease n=1 Tax=Streptomyces sp. yr375 TaxID=1761906 RepID=UPI0008C1219E|nr:Uma2 family endonuclease [Streptomyces sp. yr375]SEQ69042.1 Endonuclease, Uma2 family (restriction endonuclease fold) [Streptomyces sp. yr375]